MINISILNRITDGAVSGISLVEVIEHSSLTVNILLFSLLFLSVACWAIIIYKFIQYRKAMIATEQFIEIFWKNLDYNEVYKRSELFMDSPITTVFRAGFKEFAETKESWEQKGIVVSGSKVDELAANIARAMNRESQTRIQMLESNLTLLATTASAGPFMGLFGTVWGLMNAFHQIGKTGSASLATVSPAISEALVTTAAGIAAAIPAAIMFNFFSSKLQKIEGESANIISDFLNYIKRSNV